MSAVGRALCAWEIEKILAEKSLSDFLRQAWHVVEPSTPLVWGPHLDALCLHLEAVSQGAIKNLLVNVPPGTTKSICVGVVWPAWTWINNPGLRWLTSSSDGDLVLRDAVACRRLIESDWYRERWGNRFRMTSDQNVKGWYENDKRGFRTATTTGGVATGKKGDILLSDDPQDARKVMSEVYRQNTRDWWNKAFYNRVNNHVTGRRVVIGQRTHEDDLFATILNTGGFTHLMIPEEFDPARKCRTFTDDGALLWEDWRTVDGELLRPERFGPAEIKQAKARLGIQGYSAQHNQRPLPDEGILFKRQWFPIVDVAPIIAERVRAWDKAGTADGGDYSVGILMAKTADGIYYVEDMARGQWSAHERHKVMEQVARMDADRYGNKVAIWIEQEPGSGGKESAEYTIKQLAGYNVHAERPTGDKIVRARPFASQAGAGNIRVVKGQWNRDYIDEMTAFPAGKNDDAVDASSLAFAKLALGVKREARWW